LVNKDKEVDQGKHQSGCGQGHEDLHLKTSDATDGSKWRERIREN